MTNKNGALMLCLSFSSDGQKWCHGWSKTIFTPSYWIFL